MRILRRVIEELDSGLRSPDHRSGSTSSISSDIDEEWLSNFYSECGREITLAYTTLNQMKNWAMAVVAAFVSAILAFVKEDSVVQVEVFLAAVMAWMFNLRLFIRSILCYTNLVRWNQLQNAIITWQLDGAEDLEGDFRKKFQDYYVDWASPINRRTQLLSNLKLGFGLLLSFPLLFLISGAILLWGHPLVKGLTVFATLGALVEFTDFFRSRYFDTASARADRPDKTSIFPVPVSGVGYFVTWLATVVISLLVATWHLIVDLIC